MLIYKFPDEQYCELGLFKKLFLNANFFSFFQPKLLSRKSIAGKKTKVQLLLIFEQKRFGRFSQNFIVTVPVFYQREELRKISKKSFNFECPDTFFHGFPEIDFHTSRRLFEKSV